MQVRAEGLERMNLLGLFMLAALQERVEALGRSGARDEVAIESGGMVVTLSFSPQEAVVHSGVHGKPRARLIGPLDALVDFAQGRFVTPLARRRIRIAGDPLALLPLARVFGGGLVPAVRRELTGLIRSGR